MSRRAKRAFGRRVVDLRRVARSVSFRGVGSAQTLCVRQRATDAGQGLSSVAADGWAFVESRIFKSASAPQGWILHRIQVANYDFAATVWLTLSAGNCESKVRATSEDFRAFSSQVHTPDGSENRSRVRLHSLMIRNNDLIGLDRKLIPPRQNI
jgi:hypothetical protein